MKKSNLIFMIVFAFFIFYIANRGGELYFSSADATTALSNLSENIDKIFDDIYIATDKNSLMCGSIGVVGFGMAVVYFVTGRRNYAYKIEHGSAKWGTASDIAKYKDKNYQNNMLFTQTERMSLNTRQTMKNNNVIVIGGAGTGKTRGFIKPNLMQMHSSYVLTDPKGTVMREVGKMFADNGYVIKTFNTVDFSKSMHYNPFSFIKKEDDILVFVDNFMKSTSKKGQNANDPFWENAEKMLYLALVGYIFFEFDETERNFSTLLQMINSMEIHEDDESYMNTIDYLFEELELGTVEFYNKYGKEIPTNYKIKPPTPEHFALNQYKKYKLAAGKTAKSILVSCGARLSPFDVSAIRELTSYDEMELGTLGDKKSILFIIIDDKVTTYNFLVSMMYSQLFKELCDKADIEYGGRLPVHVRCLLDEFANIGQIPEFEKVISVTRSREISIDVIVQNLAQIEALYDKQAGTILGNCDSTLFLGSGEEKVCDYIAKRVGKTTIDHKGTSESKGSQGSYSIQDQIIARDLITSDEVSRLPNDECIFFITGLKPFKSRKFDIKTHPNYKKSADFNKENLFDIEKYNEKLDDDFINEYLIDDDFEEAEII